MKTFDLNPTLTMTKEELLKYNSLPDNLPDNSLTAKQKEFVSELYYKYITRYIDNQGYNLALYKQEQSEKWPSGPRVKEHEAKRLILNQLIELQSERRIKMDAEQAADFFFASLHWRKTNQTVIKNAYNL